MTVKSQDTFKLYQAKQLKADTRELITAAKKIPEVCGLRKEWQKSEYDGATPILALVKDGVQLLFRPGGVGTTRFKAGDTWRTFDRRGVEDSFYWKPFDYEKDRKIDYPELIKTQLDRVEKSLEFYKTSITVPQIGCSVSPAGAESLRKDLKKTGWVTFFPSGFGTGHRVSKSRPTGRYSNVRRAEPELETFLGHSPLWVEGFDAD